jgi:organic hydroperoxide reductase OsmC/OhrA
MKSYPHHYRVALRAEPEGDIAVTADGLANIETAPPAEFGGPGNRWSPETLLVAAVADCFALSFRAIARASRLGWQSLACEAEGVLDQRDGVTRFVEFHIHVDLGLPAGGDEQKAHRLLEKAERVCLITNSLVAGSTLDLHVHTA